MIDFIIEVFSCAVLFFGLARALRFGVFSPYFLIMIHLALGIPFRYFVLKSGVGKYDSIFFNLISVSPYMLLSLTVAALVVICFCELSLISVSSGKHRAVNRFFTTPIQPGNAKQTLRLLIFSVACLTIYLLYTVYALGGVSGALLSFSSRVSDNVSGLGYVGILWDLFVTSLLVLFYLTLKSAAVKRYRYIVYALILIAMCLFFVKGGRGNLIQFILSLMIILELIKKRVTMVGPRVLLVVFLVLVVTTVGLASRYSSQRNIGFSEASAHVAENLLNSISAPFALYDHFYLATKYVARNDYDYGLFYLEMPLRVVPRSVWEEKPEVLGKLVRGEFFGDAQGGVPPGIFGEFYITFGLFGVIFLSALFGLWLGWLHKIFLAAYESEQYIAFVAVISPYICFNLVRGGLDVGFVRVAIYCFALYFVIKLYRVKFKVKER